MAVGAALLAVRAVWGYLRLSRQVALACKTPDGCFSGPCVPTPFTLGLLRPRVYLPAGWLAPPGTPSSCTSAPTSAGATR